MSHKPLTVDAVLAASRATDARLQALAPVFARLAESLNEAAKSLAPKPVKFSFDGIEASRGKGAAPITLDPMLSCNVRAERWEADLAIGFDRSLLFAVTEAMFGGSGEEQPYSEERPLSNIEKQIAKTILDMVIRAMETAFQGIAETSFVKPDQEKAGSASGQASPPPSDIFIRMLAHLWGYSGELLIGLPKAAVLMLQDKLKVPSVSAQAPRQTKWSGHIQHQISDANVSLTAVLSEFDMPLDDIARLRKGQVIKVATKLGEPVMLVSDGETIFSCALGQSQGRYVLSVNGPPSGH
jgi:flagellar motor switch protein FliM